MANQNNKGIIGRMNDFVCSSQCQAYVSGFTTACGLIELGLGITNENYVHYFGAVSAGLIAFGSGARAVMTSNKERLEKRI